MFQPFLRAIREIARLVLNTNFAVFLNLPGQSESNSRFLHLEEEPARRGDRPEAEDQP